MHSHWAQVGEGLLLAAVIGVSAYFVPGTLVFLAAQVFCLLYAAHGLAPKFFPQRPHLQRLILSLGVLLAVQSLLQTLAYYTGLRLGEGTDAFTEGLSLFLGYIVTLPSSSPTYNDEGLPLSTVFDWLRSHGIWMFIGCASATIGSIFIIRSAQHATTLEAIRTPWTLLAPGTIIAFLLICGALWLLAWRVRLTVITWLSATLFFALLGIITVLVYPLGFGFDGFLHRASESLMLTTGTLTPKPLYYIGQYVFTTWLTRTFHFSLRSTDILLLLPCLALLTAALSRKKWDFFLVAFVFLVPLQPWITTTPQSLAYLVGLTGLWLGLMLTEDESFFPALAFGTWSAAIHPLAGLPLLGGIVLCIWRHRLLTFPRLRFTGSILLGLGVALVVPLAFFINSLHSSTSIAWQINSLFSFDRLRELATLFIAPPVRISLWADWSAWVEFMTPFVVLALAIVGMSFTKHTHSPEDDDSLELISLYRWLAFTGALIAVAAWCLQHVATFTFLIDYERQDYTQRLFLIAQLLFLPPACTGFVVVWERVKRAPALSMYAWLVFLFAWQGARIYHAFPYHDATHIEHGWSASAHDKEAVRWIERDSSNTPYTVLADQAVSAMAVSELGFKRYAGPVFFYPIPTGGDLYQVFLHAASIDMSMSDIQKAADLGNSSRVYVVLNRYWWESDQVADKLKTLANMTYDIGEGDVRIYRFDVTKSKNF